MGEGGGRLGLFEVSVLNVPRNDRFMKSVEEDGFYCSLYAVYEVP